MQYTSLTLEIKKLNSLVPVHRTLFCVKIYGSYKRLKNSPVFMTHPIFTRYMHLVTSCSGGGAHAGIGLAVLTLVLVIDRRQSGPDGLV